MRFILLILALVWFVAAIVMFNRGQFTIRGTNISAGWFAVAACGYFLLRWWTANLRRQTTELNYPSIKRERRAEPREPISEFMFDQPNPNEPGKLPDPNRPASNGELHDDSEGRGEGKGTS